MDEKLEISQSSKKKGGFAKLFMIGLPLFIVQLVVVYFITANLILKPAEGDPTAHEGKDTTEHVEEESADTETDHKSGPIGTSKFTVEGITVNPAFSNGKNWIQVDVGFDVATAEDLKQWEELEFALKDIIIGVISSKDLNQLSSTGYKDTLKAEITREVKKRTPLPVNQVFFGKYVIQ